MFVIWCSLPSCMDLHHHQHKIDARVNPGDIFYQPASYGRLRENLRNVQDKMYRQRQLLDRYLDPVNMSTSSTPRKYAHSGAFKHISWHSTGEQDGEGDGDMHDWLNHHH
jgi:hypothetical protein